MTTGRKLQIAVFASHGGSNLQALIDGCASGQINGEIALVISNNRKAFALERARNHHLDTLVISDRDYASEEEYAEKLIASLTSHTIELICLAGYMKKIPTRLIAQFRDRIINVHPALLPKYGGSGMYGIHVHEAVLAAGEKITGVTVHVVDEIYDHGKILAQREIGILADDTPETLQNRVLEIEHELYTEVVAQIAKAKIKMEM